MKQSRIRMAASDLFKKKETARIQALETPWFDQPDIPWNEYPRPQFRRESFFCLNGYWRFAINGEDAQILAVVFDPQKRKEII